jgi:hypothetical protein
MKDEARIEPVKRMCGGYGPRYVAHRFPIKGGVTWAQIFAKHVEANSALLARLKAVK